MALWVLLTVGAVSAVAVTLFLDKEAAVEEHSHAQMEQHITVVVTGAVVLR